METARHFFDWKQVFGIEYRIYRRDDCKRFGRHKTPTLFVLNLSWCQKALGSQAGSPFPCHAANNDCRLQDSPTPCFVGSVDPEDNHNDPLGSRLAGSETIRRAPSMSSAFTKNLWNYRTNVSFST
jgi:hypothetical protein